MSGLPVRGGSVPDGGGAPAYRADGALRGGRIAAIAAGVPRDTMASGALRLAAGDLAGIPLDEPALAMDIRSA